MRLARGLVLSNQDRSRHARMCAFLKPPATSASHRNGTFVRASKPFRGSVNARVSIAEISGLVTSRVSSVALTFYC